MTCFLRGRKRIFAGAFLLCSLLLSAPSNGQVIPGSNRLGPVQDLADVPLNREDPLGRLKDQQNQFFPTLLGLTSGAPFSTIRTRHFTIYFSTAEQTARRIAEFADDVFERVVSYYPTTLERYTPVHLVVTDGSDVQGNAFFDPTRNLIVFYASPFDIEVRGSSDWVRNVFTHETDPHDHPHGGAPRLAVHACPPQHLPGQPES